MVVPELVNGFAMGGVARWNELQLVSKLRDLLLQRFVFVVDGLGELFAVRGLRTPRIIQRDVFIRDVFIFPTLVGANFVLNHRPGGSSWIVIGVSNASAAFCSSMQR